MCLRQLGTCVHTDFKVTEKKSDAVIMRIDKPCGINGCICCLPSVTIFDGMNNVLGTVETNCTIFYDRFSVKDETKNEIGYIYGACCQFGKFCHCPCGPCSR